MSYVAACSPTNTRIPAAASYNNLAHTLNLQGKYAEARPHFEKAIEVRCRLLGADHPDTASSYSNLAIALVGQADGLSFQGKHAAALPLYEKALEIHLRLFSDNNADTASAYNSVAVNLLRLGRYSQAQPHFERRSKSVVDRSPTTILSADLQQLGGQPPWQGNLAEAQCLPDGA